ncbi:MAG: 30S ribosomal protein S20 [Alphaproteobacteria bacterium]|nr:30S ribosomal protein S20 [Alphaproteobacteria bacterium]MBE8220299.1 30S ribosomal protein S20 [Alphaproteobacteria bacterium]
MANTSSAKKMVRKIAKRTILNKDRRSHMRGQVRSVEEAIADGNKEAAMAAFRAAQPLIARAGQKGLLHHRTASRKISRLSKRISAL